MIYDTRVHSKFSEDNCMVLIWRSRLPGNAFSFPLNFKQRPSACKTAWNADFNLADQTCWMELLRKYWPVKASVVDCMSRAVMKCQSVAPSAHPLKNPQLRCRCSGSVSASHEGVTGSIPIDAYDIAFFILSDTLYPHFQHIFEQTSGINYNFL